jgi:lipopolysaccharide/colanic/teichoic acid biosynthesis glycosyltransferase
MTALEGHAWTPDVIGSTEAELRIVSRSREESRYHGRRRYVKRALDISLVVLTLPITVPVMLILAAIIKATSGGPVLFRQKRVGFHGELFEVLKFRTMFADAGERMRQDPELHLRYLRNDFKLSSEEDPRIAPFGRFLRRSSLDELPQLFNVLRGTMSLVGPRPILVEELECYGPWAYAYLEVKPGITGRWQTDGRNNVRYPERAKLDAEYFDNWRLWTDVVILFKTVPRVLRRHGSH